MKLRFPQAARWLLCACTVVMLAACGGGGGGGETEQPRDDSGDTVIPTPPPPTADPRNGSYTMLASDGYEYTLTLDFDAKTYKVAGNGIDENGAIEASGSEFEFKPGNAEGSAGFNTIRFSYVDNTVVGEYALPTGALPFIAARSFATSLPSTTLTFNLVGRWLDLVNNEFSTTVEQAQITTDGKIRICSDKILHEIDSCPETSLFEAPLSISGSQFSYAANDTLTVTFRLANVGADPIYLRASASNGSGRRFIIGTPAAMNFPLGSFAGATTGPAWGNMSIQFDTFSVSLTSRSGAKLEESGTISTIDEGTLGSVAFGESPTLGQVVGVRSTSLSAFITAPGTLPPQSHGGLFLGTLR